MPLRKRMRVLVLLGMTTLGGPVLAADAGVRIEAGRVSGTAGRDPAITVYKGIPYAAPPIAALRWKPPVAPVHWSGVRKADAFGPDCAQSSDVPVGGSQDEDCLTLNVWSGARSPAEKRPVIVWFHVFMTGSSASPQSDGEGLAKKGVVVVTVNFRIGPFGFLATPELTRESGHNASGNYGIMDQIATLQWVRRNIAAFGGDPARVTVAGVSAQRGSTVGYLSVAPLARGLFKRAISQSTFPVPSILDAPSEGPANYSLEAAEAQGSAFMVAHNAGSLAELRSLPWQALVGSPGGARGPRPGGEGAPSPAGAADGEGAPGAGRGPRGPASRGQGRGPGAGPGGGGAAPAFAPVVDGWVVPRYYADPAARGSQADAVYVAGNNLSEGGAPATDEIARMRVQGPGRPGRAQANVTLDAYLAWARLTFAARADAFLRLYPAATDDDAARENNEAVRDYARFSTWTLLDGWRRPRAGGNYAYFWTHFPPGSNGAGHTSDIPYWFNSLDAVSAQWTAADRHIADVMSSYWVNIAGKGDPNGRGLPRWSAVDPAAPTAMELGDRFGPIPVTSADKLAFWRSYADRRRPGAPKPN